jgi:hypothetical protein
MMLRPCKFETRMSCIHDDASYEACYEAYNSSSTS